MRNKPTVIGIAGGTGSGKTTIARKLKHAYGPGEVVVIEQDAYYHDLSQLALEKRQQQNFDHPAAIDIDLFQSQLTALLAGETIKLPLYDFTIHTRKPETVTITPHHVIVLEGILVLHYPALRKFMDIKIYVETPRDIRFIRRLSRDIRKRGRTTQSVIDQYIATVRPMHELYVKPSKEYADLIIPEGGKNKVAVDLLRTKIDSFLVERK
ncbi:MAG: uridine kinase [Candidatus Marinimicrobia bacterium]|nr:uridine kinase [Candidatus Neomarinimicrobiota bacterium]